MADILESIKGVVPNVSMQGVSNVAMMAMVTLLVVLIVGGLFGLWAYNYMMKKKFNITIQIFEKINGKYRPTKKDKAMELSVGTEGLKAIFLKGLKRYRAKPTLQQGDRTYWLAIDEENNLVNFEMTDIDMHLREMKIETTETESRANRIAFQKALGDRLKHKESFWDKYGKSIMNVIYIVLITIAIVFVLAKVGNILSSVPPILERMAQVEDKQATILTALDNIARSCQT